MALSPPTPRSSFKLVVAMLAMIAVPAGLTLHTVRVPSATASAAPNPSPYGYTVSLLLFLVPIVVIGLWLVPREGVRISKKAFRRTIGLLFPIGAGLDFFFAHRFFLFPNNGATLGIKAPAFSGGVPIEEYVFYLTGFISFCCVISGSTSIGSRPTPSPPAPASARSSTACCVSTQCRRSGRRS